MKPRDKYTNKPEQAFKEFADRLGWQITKRGWPDFLVKLPSGKFAVVEVKPTSRTNLKEDQKLVLEWLTSLGVQSFVWNPEDKLVPIVL